MQELEIHEIELVGGGGGPLADAATFFGGAAAISGGLAAVPTPASPALAGFAVMTGVLSAAMNYADNRIGQRTNVRPYSSGDGGKL